MLIYSFIIISYGRKGGNALIRLGIGKHLPGWLLINLSLVRVRPGEPISSRASPLLREFRRSPAPSRNLGQSIIRGGARPYVQSPSSADPGAHRRPARGNEARHRRQSLWSRGSDRSNSKASGAGVGDGPVVIGANLRGGIWARRLATRPCPCSESTRHRGVPI